MPDKDDTKLPLTSETPVEGRADALKELFPEVFSEDKIDFDKLRQALGEDVATGRERYGLSWAGKSEAVRAVQIPSVGTLNPDRDESVDFDTTENLFIEGDNLEVLKLLQKSYYGKIKMIYIDPPYNTGNDFIYPDNFREGLQDYLVYSGQVDADGVSVSTSSDTSGRIHSKWLSMLFPRLFLARNLLTEDGVLVVSIDDNEVYALRMVLNEIFGDENFIGQIVWKSRKSEDTRAKTGLSTDHEYLVCYRRTDSAKFRGTKKDLTKFANPDSDPRGLWRSADLTGLATKDRRPNLHYDLIDPDTNINYGCPPRGWRYDPKTMAQKVKEGRVLWPPEPSGRPRHKLFLDEMDNLFKNMSSVVLNVNTGDGTRETNAILGNGVFDFPKPTKLIKTLATQILGEKDILLDFFSGSAPSAHSLLELNRKDGGSRRFIMVQLPEPTPTKSEAYKAGYKTIAEIGKERIRRVIKQLKEDEEGKLAFKDREQPEDLGFRVFKLGASNFKIWQGDEAPTDSEALSNQLKMFADHVLKGRPEEAVLYELILKSGLPLTAKVQEKRAAGKEVYLVEEEEVRLAICLEKEITQDALRAMMEFLPQQVLCLDSAFEGNDQLKTNTVLEMKSHEIKFRTV